MTISPARPDRRSAESTPTTTVVPPRADVRPVGLREVTLTGGHWAERQRVNGAHTLPHVVGWLDRSGWLVNFDLAAIGSEALVAGRRGREFSDSEVYKWLEAAAWELARTGSEPVWPELTVTFEAVVARVAAAQEPDGYLNTSFGRDGQPPRWSDLEWGHELYCAGHLMQAAVACHRSGRPDHRLVRVARAVADLVCDVFGPGANEGICGHAEVELGLVELGRALGEERYARLAAWFVDQHGRGTLDDIEFGRGYFQDDVPVREATVLRGHAVRANYLSAAAVDVSVDRGDDGMLAAVAAQNRAALERRTYLTGGQGSQHQDEGFGEDWALPPDRAYSETCASIGSIMLAWRLLLQTGEAQYADQIERILYNVVSTAVADDGRAFFYANPLHQRAPGLPVPETHQSRRASSAVRAPWFDVSCCPTNLSRTFASLSTLMATSTADGVQIHQYADADLEVALRREDGSPTGERVRLRMRTAYPEDGIVRVEVLEAPAGWTLDLRVPGWCDGARVQVDGLDRSVDAGTVRLEGPPPGSTVELDLDLSPRLLEPHPRVDAVRGCVAIQRGPEVWALESIDLVDAGVSADLADVRLSVEAGTWMHDGRVHVAVVPTARTDPGRRPSTADVPSPDGLGTEEREVALVRYRDWASRGPSTMRVWIPVTTP